MTKKVEPSLRFTKYDNAIDYCKLRLEDAMSNLRHAIFILDMLNDSIQNNEALKQATSKTDLELSKILHQINAICEQIEAYLHDFLLIDERLAP